MHRLWTGHAAEQAVRAADFAGERGPAHAPVLAAAERAIREFDFIAAASDKKRSTRNGLRVTSRHLEAAIGDLDVRAAADRQQIRGLRKRRVARCVTMHV